MPRERIRAVAYEAMREAGFEPKLRDQQYSYRELPENIEQQVIAYLKGIFRFFEK